MAASTPRARSLLRSWWTITIILLLPLLSPPAAATAFPRSLFKRGYYVRSSPPKHLNALGTHDKAEKKDRPVWGPPPVDAPRTPLRVTNNCRATLWPAIFTQHGIGPGIGGFELAHGDSIELWVGSTWQGRIWGRTNCTVSAEDVFSCETGDCGNAHNCVVTGAVPATLFEANLAGGQFQNQVYYDISLVDGYNLPVGVRFMPYPNTSWVPPNLVNPACIATSGWLASSAPSGDVYSNATYPVPWEDRETNESVQKWCPWDLLRTPPAKPGDGVYAYPDDGIERPAFSPCLSRCQRTGADEDCCTGRYQDAQVCKPSLYSQRAKQVCPDAYSFAYDDNKSTFVVPSYLGGFETIFCPEGRSTNILATLGQQLAELSMDGRLSAKSLAVASNASYIDSASSRTGSAPPKAVPGNVLAVAGLVATVLVLVR